VQLQDLDVPSISKQAAHTHEAIAKLTRKLRTLKLQDGLTHERLSALGAILAHEPISVSQLAEIESVRVATVSRMITGLEELGLAKRQSDISDGRGVLVATTPKGKRAYERSVLKALEQILSLIGELEPEQLTAVKSLLKECR